MSEVKKIATRESYGETLVELGAEHEEIVVLDADLAAATKTGLFQAAYPERFINCGIAESNMIGVAAGLAAAGKVPFASSFAMFAAGRAYEQVRNSVGYPHLNVKIGATHAGISVGEDGATHQCNEDIALMRTIPGMVVINPSDDIEARAAVRAAYEYVGPVYMRFGRLAVPVINDRPDYKFELGKGVVLREGKDVTIIATGLLRLRHLHRRQRPDRQRRRRARGPVRQRLFSTLIYTVSRRAHHWGGGRSAEIWTDALSGNKGEPYGT